MGSVADFLKHLPDAASSPLAFVAYGLLIAGWVVQSWLRNNPKRATEKILAQFHDDQLRYQSLKEVFREDPPPGLKGNDAILAWVKSRSDEKSRVYLLIGWIATLLAVLLFLVALNNAATPKRQVHIQIHRIGVTADCPMLPLTAHVILKTAGGQYQDLPVVENCKADVSFAASAKGAATLDLANAGPYRVADSTAKFDIAATSWDVYVTTSAQARLRLSLFAYSGVQCPDVQGASTTFEEILRAKALSLRGMFDPRDKRYDYLTSINVVPAGRALDLDQNGMLDYWQKTASLQIMSGLCFRQSSGEFMRSQIFFGGLSGGLANPFFADMPLSADEFGASQDLHTASILYALAQDAESQKADADLTISYLSRAREVVSQIHADAAAPLLQAIDSSLRRLGAPTRMTL